MVKSNQTRVASTRRSNCSKKTIINERGRATVSIFQLSSQHSQRSNRNERNERERNPEKKRRNNRFQHFFFRANESRRERHDKCVCYVFRKTTKKEAIDFILAATT